MANLQVLPSNRFSRVVTGLVVIVLFLGLGWFIDVPWFSSWDFRHNLWSPSYLLVRDANPYGMGAPLQTVPSVWFPMVIGVFFPLGWLNQFEATNVWLLINLVTIGTTVWIAGGQKRPNPLALGFGLSAALLFPPVLSHLLLGQFSILASALFLITSYLVQSRHVLPSAILTALALTKPQLGVLALPGVLIGFYRTGGIRHLAIFVFALIASILWFTLPVWLVNPMWLRDILEIIREMPDWFQPSLFKILQHTFGEYGVVVWLVLALGIFVVNIWLWLKLAPPKAMIWSLALTTLASPYIWSWDFVLLLPLWVNILSQVTKRQARLLLIFGYLICWGIMIWIRLMVDISDDLFWWVPLLIIAVVYSGHKIEIFLAGSSSNNSYKDKS